MLYCAKCMKEVEIFGISSGAPDAEKIVEGALNAARRAGKLILFNPPPMGPHHCPSCGGKLVEGKR